MLWTMCFCLGHSVNAKKENWLCTCKACVKDQSRMECCFKRPSLCQALCEGFLCTSFLPFLLGKGFVLEFYLIKIGWTSRINKEIAWLGWLGLVSSLVTYPTLTQKPACPSAHHCKTAIALLSPVTNHSTRSPCWESVMGFQGKVFKRCL